MKEIKYLPDPEYDYLEDLEPFSGVNCIVSDIDGTMTSGGNDLYAQINKFNKTQKIYFTVATGRTYQGAIRILRQINIKKRTIIALYNGAIVLRYGTCDVLMSSYLSDDLIKNLMMRLQMFGLKVFLYSFEVRRLDPFVHGKEFEVIEKVHGFGGITRDEYDVNHQLIKWIDTVDELPTANTVSILISSKELSNKELSTVETICEEYESINVTSSGNGFIEIASKNSNKGNIIPFLKREFNNDEPIVILAAGDNDNDIELFNSADIRVAVSNASRELLVYTDYLCINKAESGFIDLLNTIANAKKYIV